jgi:hypothetical protein
VADVATLISGAVGLLVGHVLTRSWQYQQWQLDHKRSEYRDLLTKLTLAYSATRQHPTLEGDLQEKAFDITDGAFSCMKDRIFIADEVERLRIFERWIAATRAFNDDPHSRESARALLGAYEGIRSDLVTSALKTFRDAKYSYPEDEPDLTYSARFR